MKKLTNSQRSGAPRLKNRLGATAVEFAFVAPVALFLIFGLFECCRFVMVQQALTNAAREGSRTAVLATTSDAQDVDTDVRNYLRTTLANPTDQDLVRITIEPDDFSDLDPHTPITTSVAISYSDVSWLPNWLIGNLEMLGTATMERD